MYIFDTRGLVTALLELSFMAYFKLFSRLANPLNNPCWVIGTAGILTAAHAVFQTQNVSEHFLLCPA